MFRNEDNAKWAKARHTANLASEGSSREECVHATFTKIGCPKGVPKCDTLFVERQCGVSPPHFVGWPFALKNKWSQWVGLTLDLFQTCVLPWLVRGPPRNSSAARPAWFRRWCTALTAQAFALSLLERRGWRRRRGALDLWSSQMTVARVEVIVFS